MNTRTTQVGTLAVMLAGLASPALAASFNFTNFDSASSSMSLNGVVSGYFNSIPVPFPQPVAAFTTGLAGDSGKTLTITPPIAGSAGSAWYNTKENVGGGFTTDFSFRIRDKNGIGANGFAFVIQNSGLNALGSPGTGTGYAENPTYPSIGTGIQNSLAIVFDTWYDGLESSTNPGGDFLAVQTRGGAPNSVAASASLGSAVVANAFNDGNTHNVEIRYIPGLGIDIYYDNLASPVLHVDYNISGQLGLSDGNAYIGFTASTGSLANAERHEILNWSYNDATIPAPAGAAMLGLGGLLVARRKRAL